MDKILVKKLGKNWTKIGQNNWAKKQSKKFQKKLGKKWAKYWSKNWAKN